MASGVAPCVLAYSSSLHPPTTAAAYPILHFKCGEASGAKRPPNGTGSHEQSAWLWMTDELEVTSEKSVFCKVALVHTAVQLPLFCHVARVPTLCEQVTRVHLVDSWHNELCAPHHLSQLLVGVSWEPANNTLHFIRKTSCGEHIKQARVENKTTHK